MEHKSLGVRELREERACSSFRVFKRARMGMVGRGRKGGGDPALSLAS
jgi:hypothetical protein